MKTPITPRARSSRLIRLTGVLLALQSTVLFAAAPPPTMIGINLSAAGFGSSMPGTYGTDYIYPDGAFLDYYKARGIELIRFPFKWERVQRTLYGPLDTAEMARFDAFLDEVEKRGMRVIPDMHNYARRQQSGGTHLIGSAQVPLTAYQDAWEKLAAHFKDRDCIWAYDIMNEPHQTDPYPWKDTAQAAVDAIRLHDMRHAILLPGYQYSGAHWWLTHSTNLLTVTDPANNLIFQAHQYFDNDSSGKYDASYDVEGANPNKGVTTLTNFVNWCTANGVRGFVGEYGVPDDDPRWLTLLENTLAFMAANNISGTYWAGGPKWGAYKLSAEMRPLHKEAPQMATLINYGDGVGTRYWPPFVWYKDAIAPSPAGTYPYLNKSATATVAANFGDTDSATGSYTGARSVRIAGLIPPGGSANGGFQLNGGADITANRARGHVLSFYIKGTPGSSARVFFRDASGAGTKVDSAAYVATNGTWQQVRIPLTALLDGTSLNDAALTRISFDLLPADGAERVWQLDQFAIERPEHVAPAITVASPGGSSFGVGASFTATATATDASGIDFVEFLIDGERKAIDETAPYTAILSLAEAGAHRLTAIAYDNFGNPGRSTPVVLTGQTSSRHLTAHDTGSSQSFSTGLHWNDSQAPAPGSAYVVDALDLRTSGVTTNITFAGDSLALNNGARLLLRTLAPSVVTIANLQSNDGTIALANVSDFVLAGAITLNAGGLDLTTGGTGRTLTIASSIGGSGGLTHSMAAASSHVTLTHANNTYSGGTLVAAGLLRAHADRALGAGDVTIASSAKLRLAQGSTHDYVANSADVIVASTGTLELAFTGTDTIGALSLNGGTSNVATGIWGAPGSGAANTSSRLTGTGWLNVTSN